MKLIQTVRTYLRALTPRSVWLLALGLIPIFIALGTVLLAHKPPEPLWLKQGFSLWADSIGISLLMLTGGAALLDYAEKKDNEP